MKHALRIAIPLAVLDLILLVTLITPAAVALMLLLRQRWSWLLTPDVPLPGDLTLPEVQTVYDAWGYGLCSLYWLGWRNRLHGLDFTFAQRLPMAWDESAMGLQTQGALWWCRRPILGGARQLKSGWRQVVVDGIPYGVPCFTITVP